MREDRPGPGVAAQVRLLSRREWEAAFFAVQGLTNKEIAHELRLAEQSAKNALARAFRKLAVHRRVELLRYFGRCFRRGYVCTH